jgi:hypothetical protein
VASRKRRINIHIAHNKMTKTNSMFENMWVCLLIYADLKLSKLDKHKNMEMHKGYLFD